MILFFLDKCTISDIKELGKKVLDEINKYHDDRLFGGHKGRKRLYAELSASYYWKQMSKYISEYNYKCLNCQLDKPTIGNTEYLKITERPISVFDKIIIIDTIIPLPKSSNNKIYAVTIICELSRLYVYQ